MLPVVTSNVVFTPPQSAPLVNTVILGSQVTRVPSDNVPPTISNPQVENNTKGNGSLFTNARNASEEAPESESFLTNPASARRPFPKINIPSTFLAQLLGQQGKEAFDVATQNLLRSNEKLAENNNPPPPPQDKAARNSSDLAGAFGTLLRNIKAVDNTEEKTRTQAANEAAESRDIEAKAEERRSAGGPTVLPPLPEPTVLPPLPDPSIFPPKPEPTVIEAVAEAKEQEAAQQSTVPDAALFSATEQQISAYQNSINRHQIIEEPLRSSFVSELFNA